MDGYNIAALVLFGADWLLFLLAMVQAFRVFPQKRKRFFILVVVGLCAAILFESVSVAVFQFNVNPLWGLLSISGWYVMITCCNFVYAIRIRSLGVYGGVLDRVASCIPWFFLGLLTPIYVIAMISPALPINPNSAAVKVVATVLQITLSGSIAVGEIFLFVVLLRKVQMILEFRDDVRRRLMRELSVSVAVLVALEIAVLVSKFVGGNYDRLLRPLVYILRFFLVIRFYDDLLEDINRGFCTDVFELGRALDVEKGNEINALTIYFILFCLRGSLAVGVQAVDERKNGAPLCRSSANEAVERAGDVGRVRSGRDSHEAGHPLERDVLVCGLCLFSLHKVRALPETRVDFESLARNLAFQSMAQDARLVDWVDHVVEEEVEAVWV